MNQSPDAHQPRFKVGDLVIPDSYSLKGKLCVVQAVISQEWLKDQVYARPNEDEYYLRREGGKQKAKYCGSYLMAPSEADLVQATKGVR
jgi:hypothetical protein